MNDGLGRAKNVQLVADDARNIQAALDQIEQGFEARNIGRLNQIFLLPEATIPINESPFDFAEFTAARFAEVNFPENQINQNAENGKNINHH